MRELPVSACQIASFRRPRARHVPGRAVARISPFLRFFPSRTLRTAAKLGDLVPMPDPLQETLSSRSYLSGPSHGVEVRQRGRPRLATPAEGAVQDRRSQIRRAQRTYRLKKEATLENLRSRVATLERTLGTVSGLVDNLHDTVTADDSLSPSHRILLDQIQTTLHSQSPRRLLPDDDGTRSREQDLDVFGYHISHIPAALHGSIFTYSHLERTLARRLHRFALEQTYTWFTDRSASPGWIVHVFGLLPCLPDRHAVQRNYLRVLRAGVDECLEGRVLPFYTIGGAGMHYPRRDAAGQPVYPQNMREPKRILDRAVEAMLGRGGDAISGKQQRQLQMLGFEGEWFDCHDVQEYLDSLGITLDGNISSATVPPGAVQLFSEAAEPETSRLDVERFLSTLVPNTRILGRAPGFKKSDVDDALKASIQFS